VLHARHVCQIDSSLTPQRKPVLALLELITQHSTIATFVAKVSILKMVHAPVAALTIVTIVKSLVPALIARLTSQIKTESATVLAGISTRQGLVSSVTLPSLLIRISARTALKTAQPAQPQLDSAHLALIPATLCLMVLANAHPMTTS
jgi:hypothetical protein